MAPQAAPAPVGVRGGSGIAPGSRGRSVLSLHSFARCPPSLNTRASPRKSAMTWSILRAFSDAIWRSSPGGREERWSTVVVWRVALCFRRISWMVSSTSLVRLVPSEFSGKRFGRSDWWIWDVHRGGTFVPPMEGARMSGALRISSVRRWVPVRQAAASSLGRLVASSISLVSPWSFFCWFLLWSLM